MMAQDRPARARRWPSRAAILALALPLPAHAWEAETEGPLCTLTHTTPEVTLRLTYDPGLAEYAITLGLMGATWPDAAVFALEFFGAQPNQIATSLHQLSDHGAALTVTDRGFGNVLDGLQFNDTATALAGTEAVTIPLEGAAPAVIQFRTCTEMPLA